MRIAGVLALGFLAVGCKLDESASADGTLKSDGYALFSVQNDHDQCDTVRMTVKTPDPNATYVLMYAPKAPKNAGWFLFDPSTREHCGENLTDKCEVQDYGYLVDSATADASATSLVLNDRRCGANDPDDNHNWTGRWAVMRIERTDHTHDLTLHVAPDTSDDSIANKPDIKQLQ